MPKASIQTVFESRGLFVSHETLEKLEIYEQLLLKWQKAINLVGPTTLDDIITRHFYDSAQVFKYIPNIEVTLADLGSGAGFPGLILAVMGVKDVHLVESDVRKATFLREVSRETQTPVTIHDIRAEETRIPNIDVLTARAMAPLRDLLAHMDRMIAPGHACYSLFQKGANYQDELDLALKRWQFDYEVFPSETDPEAKIIRIQNLQKK